LENLHRIISTMLVFLVVAGEKNNHGACKVVGNQTKPTIEAPPYQSNNQGVGISFFASRAIGGRARHAVRLFASLEYLVHYGLGKLAVLTLIFTKQERPSVWRIRSPNGERTKIHF
jgi:hypothetical protein